MPFASVNGIELYYETHGTGPALVLAHGGGGSHLSWWQQVPVFSKTYQVVTFDHRSFGYSRDGTAGPGPRAFVKDLTGLLDHLGIQRAALVGQSMGGWTVCGFAAACPERTSTLILCDTTAGIETPEIDRTRASLRERAQGNLAQLLTSAYAMSFPECEPALCFLYQQISALNQHISPNLVPTLMNLHTNVAPIVEHEIPTLLVVGEEDVLAPPPAMQSITTRIPQARFVTVPKAGHSAYFEQPAVFNRLVDEFVQEHRSS